MYTLKMTDDSGVVEIHEFDERPTPEECNEELADWVLGGDWGAKGCCVNASWFLRDKDGEVLDSCYTEVDVPPDHEELIRKAGGNPECDHDWTSEDMGGDKQNPGVWSTGGTRLVIKQQCIHCGIIQTEHYAGNQRDPGEPPSYFEYELPEEFE